MCMSASCGGLSAQFAVHSPILTTWSVTRSRQDYLKYSSSFDIVAWQYPAVWKNAFNKK